MNAIVSKIVAWLRDANWLTRDRATAYCRILLFITLGAAAVWIALSQGGIDRSGKPLGTDFVSFWTASQIALGGHPAEVYNIAVHEAAQSALFSRDIGYAAFFYPPPFLLICLPLAMLPYLWSLGLWLGITGCACYRVLRSWLGERFGALPIFAFPAMFSNLGHGQNAFLSAALFGGGALMLDTRPVVAGLCLGALVYKPHLAIVVPVALLAARRWRALLAAAVSAAGLCLISLCVFGADTWRAFLAASPKAKIALEQNMVGDEKMQSVFAGVRLLHGGLTLAYGLQIIVALGVCAALVRLQRRSFRSPAEGPAMVAAALLASPFLLDYDLVLLAIPLAWIVREGARAGFLPWEKIILAGAFLLPAVSRSIAAYAGIPLGPIAIAAVLLLVLRRAGEPAAVGATPRSGNANPATQQAARAHRPDADKAGRRALARPPNDDRLAPAAQRRFVRRRLKRFFVTAIPGKACGSCIMCCTALEISELNKPAGPPCPNCILSGGCTIYASRPQVCRDFECLWLTTRTLPPNMRPDRIGAILMEDDDTDEYRAVCAPARPLAWRNPRVFAHLVAVAKTGRTVVAKAGLSSWRIFASGEVGPTA